MAALILSPANYEIQLWSKECAGNSLKAKPMYTTKTVVADLPGDARTDVKSAESNFVEPALHIFPKSLVNSPRSLAHCSAKSSPDGRKTFPRRRCGTNDSDFMVSDVGGRLL